MVMIMINYDGDGDDGDDDDDSDADAGCGDDELDDDGGARRWRRRSKMTTGSMTTTLEDVKIWRRASSGMVVTRRIDIQDVNKLASLGILGHQSSGKPDRKRPFPAFTGSLEGTVESGYYGTMRWYEPSTHLV